MKNSRVAPKQPFNLVRVGLAMGVAALALFPGISLADESGVSFWLPGQVDSLPAVPGAPGWSMAEVYYHTTVSAFGAVAAAREIQIARFSPTVNVSLNASLHAQGDLVLLDPTYPFATPGLGGQLAIGVTGLFGRSAADLNGTLTTGFGQFAATRMGSIGDSITSVGDLYPLASLKWNAGVNKFMTYVTATFPSAPTVQRASPTSASATVPSMVVAATPTSIRRPDMNFRLSRDLPTISRIQTRNTRTASTSTSTGALPSFSPS